MGRSAKTPTSKSTNDRVDRARRLRRLDRRGFDHTLPILWSPKYLPYLVAWNLRRLHWLNGANEMRSMARASYRLYG